MSPTQSLIIILFIYNNSDTLIHETVHFDLHQFCNLLGKTIFQSAFQVIEVKRSVSVYD